MLSRKLIGREEYGKRVVIATKFPDGSLQPYLRAAVLYSRESFMEYVFQLKHDGYTVVSAHKGDVYDK